MPAALAGVGARRHATTRNNGSATPYTGVPRVRVAVDEPGDGDASQLSGRVRLLEGFVSRAEVSDCTQYALQWLGQVAGISQSISLVRPPGEQLLYATAHYGFTSSVVTSFTVSLEDWNNPLVAAFANRKGSFYPAAHSPADRKRRPPTPFEDAAFHVVPLGAAG